MPRGKREQALADHSQASGRLLLTLLPGLQRAREERFAASEAHRDSVNRARFRKVNEQHVEQAFRLKASVIGAGQRESTTPDFVGIFAGLSGHTIKQIMVTHSRESLRKKRKRDRETRPAATLMQFGGVIDFRSIHSLARHSKNPTD